MAQDRPNILYIMDDQHRWDYLGSMGADFVNTPNLDRLAKRGIQFTQCTTNCPVCAPARVALASGMQPHRLGALGNQCFLPRTATTYYQRLRDHNYYVGCVGKLDLAKPDHYNGRDGDRPSTYMWGFTHPVECEGKGHAGNSKTPQGPYNFFLQEKGLLDAFVDDYSGRKTTTCHDSVLPTEAFEDTFIGQRSVQWIEEIPDDFPWHLFVSFVGPHNPFDPPTEYADKYRNADVPPAILPQSGGRVSDEPVELIDTNATICEMAGLPPQSNIDAKSLCPVLKGETDQHRTEAISGLKSFRIIRTKTHKFVENHGDIDELYDLVNDPQELNNIARENRKLANELSNRMKERFIEGAWHHG